MLLSRGFGGEAAVFELRLDEVLHLKHGVSIIEGGEELDAAVLDEKVEKRRCVETDLDDQLEGGEEEVWRRWEEFRSRGRKEGEV